MASSTAPPASALLALLKEEGFDLEDVSKENENGQTPLTYFSRMGNVAMCRYLIARGADCRKEGPGGCFPWYVAVESGHLEIVQLLYHDAGAHDDIRNLGMFGYYSPLRFALRFGRFDIVHWMIRKQALSTHDSVEGGGGIDDAIMRSDLHQSSFWRDDRRLTILSWAQDSVARYNKVVQLLLTGTIVPTSLFRRHPNNPYATRSNKRRKKSSSPLVLLKGKSGILELIAHYVAGTPQQLRPLRQLNVLLPAFIEDTPFDTTLIHEDTWGYSDRRTR